MHIRKHKPSFGDWFGRLFLCSLIICLCLSYVSVTTWHGLLGKVITAQIIAPLGRLHQSFYREEVGDELAVGVFGKSDKGDEQKNLFAHRNQGNEQRAIADLQDSLKKAQKSDNLVDIAAAVNNLGNAYIKIDELILTEIPHNELNNSLLSAIDKTHINLDAISKDSAVINSIILSKKTAIIANFPNGKRKLSWINIDSKNLKQEIKEFRQGLENYGEITYSPTQAQKLYDWIILPFAKDLELLQIKNLVFIQDGILRSVPMGALHDGEKFLIEKYAVAITPSLRVTTPETVNPENFRALAVGLTKDAIVDGRMYPALTNVAKEIQEVETQFPNSKQLLDDNFTLDRLQNELRQTVYPIIHIATHGEFGNFAEDTFLVTGDNKKLTMTELYQIISSLPESAQTIDLLALTACETAIGNDQASLGIAGVALQAGVRSTLASLWSIDDSSTVKLVSKFYKAWRHLGVSKAEALRVAQQSLISAGEKYAHPAYWAGFILVGNWM